MSDDPRMADVQRQLLRPESPEVVRGLLPVLDNLKSSPESAKAAEELLRRTFKCFRQLTAAEPDQAAEILTGDLLPRCLLPDREEDTNFGPKLCYTFGEWLDDLPEVHRHRVRMQALPQAVALLNGNGSGVRNALRLISCIGYRDDDVIGALDRLVRKSADEKRDHALSALVALRPVLDPALRATYLEMLHHRIPAGPNLHQLMCGRLLGTPDTAELVWSHWLANPVSKHSERGLYVSLTLSLLTEIATRERNAGFTVRVWDWLLELSRRSTEGMDDVFSPNSSLVNSLDLPAVVPELVRLAVRAEGHHRYLYYLRVLECERSAHMAGWDAVPLAELATIRADAVGPSGNKGRFTTIELHQKEAAWDMLLCRGEPAALPPLSDALTGEGGYVIHRILELGSCFRLDPLPPVVADLLAGTADATWDENERLVAQIGAIEAARSAGTREAFEALLRYRQLGNGVLLSLVEALAETALIMLEGGDRSPAEQLLINAKTSQREDCRAAAAGAVAALVEEALTSQEMAQAAALIALAATDPYARRELLFALATRPPADVPPAAAEYAAGVLATPATEEDVVAGPALALVGRQPEVRSDPEFQARHLGLTERGGVLVVSPPTLRGVVPHVVARYFADEPERFGPAVATLLRDGDASALANVLPSIRETAIKNPAVVTDALIARLRQADSGRLAEPSLLRTLAAVAPDRLLADGCGNIAAWLPQARVDLADALGGIGPLPERPANERFEILGRLAGDGIYAVRRAAYRAASVCDTDRFIGLALSWARWHEPGLQGPRRYAAECVGWLRPAEAEYFSQLGCDQEHAVRESYERSLHERGDRMTAGEFEQRVLGVNDPAGVIRNWRHGIALSRVGDDSTIRRLADRMGAGLPPSVRFWLKRVRKAVEQRWNEVTRKWPEPWYARPGHLECFSGIIKGEDGKEVTVSGTLWLMPAETPGARYSWGGWGTCDQRLLGDDGQLMIPGRWPTKVLVNSPIFPQYELSFWGNDRYPDRIQS